MADTLLDEILDNLCSYWDYFTAAVGLLAVLLLLTIAGFTVIEPGTPAYVVNVMNLVGLSALLLAIGALVLHCFRSGRVHR